MISNECRGETKGFRMYNYKRAANMVKKKKTVNTRKMSAINIDKGIPYELNKGGSPFC